ncbi:MAG: phosphoribosylglycinamide formyltransferase [Eubacteriales bacterium]|nr:phosphoribosylglycinamide formyltransferase [Eubacteriales bacterium]
MLNIGVLVSGGGTNLQAIIDRIEDGYLDKCRVAVVISNNEAAFALERAKKHNINAVYLPKGDLPDREYDKLLIERLESAGVDLVVLAGFMCILGEDFVSRFRDRIINIHPSLIPAFCGKGNYGLRPHKRVLEYGAKITGATVHFVELDTDAGPIILQKAVEVKGDDTPETLQRRVMEEAEWKLLPEAIKLISENRIRKDGRKVTIIQ